MYTHNYKPNFVHFCIAFMMFEVDINWGGVKAL